MRGFVVLFASICVSHAFAATEGTTTLSLPDQPQAESPIPPEQQNSDSKIKNILRDKKFEEDKRITDLELRANAGSLSRYSTQFFLGYSGSAVNDLSEPNRPNPDNRPGDNRTFMSGSANVRYRFTPDVAMNFGTGVVFYTPYQAVTGKEVDRPSNKKNYGINNPVVSLDKTYKYGKTQMRSSGKISSTTDQDYKNRGQWAAVGYSQFFKYTPGDSRLILGMQVALEYFGYARDYAPYVNDKNKGDGTVSKYYLNFIPSVEYKISDSVNFNTSLGYPYQNLRSDPQWVDWNHPLSTWRVGAGWAITREIYVNPYVNFFLETPAFNTASLNFNTTFSVF